MEAKNWLCLFQALSLLLTIFYAMGIGNAPIAA